MDTNRTHLIYTKIIIDFLDGKRNKKRTVLLYILPSLLESVKYLGVFKGKCCNFIKIYTIETYCVRKGYLARREGTKGSLFH